MIRGELEPDESLDFVDVTEINGCKILCAEVASAMASWCWHCLHTLKERGEAFLALDDHVVDRRKLFNSTHPGRNIMASCVGQPSEELCRISINVIGVIMVQETFQSIGSY